MSSIVYAVHTPVHYQWDRDSRLPSPDPGSAPNNCGPTSVTNIAHYYRDKPFGIYSTRLLAVANPYRATSIGEQKAMLETRGVPAIISQPSVAAIRGFAARRNHPVLIGMLMSQVPAAVRGHPFTGWHAVEILETASVANAQGVLVRDPNFSTITGRTDPTNGKRFYPNWVIQSAFVNVGGWALIPEKPKPDPAWQGRIRVDGPGRKIRYEAREDDSTIFAESRSDGFTYHRSGKRLWGNGYLYEWNGAIVETKGVRYYRVRTQRNNIRFIRVGAAIVVKKA